MGLDPWDVSHPSTPDHHMYLTYIFAHLLQHWSQSWIKEGGCVNIDSGHRTCHSSNMDSEEIEFMYPNSVENNSSR